MKKMILSFSFGTLEQHAFLYGEGDEFATEETFSVRDTVPFIFSHPDVEEITFIGPEFIVDKFIKEASEYEMATYGHQKKIYKTKL